MAAVGSVEKPGCAAVIDCPVIVEEEEHLVLDDRAADGSAKIIEVQHGNLLPGAELVRGGVQRIVLEELISSAVELVSAALRDLVVDHVAHAVLRREGCSADLYFRSRLKDRDVGVLAHRQCGGCTILQNV